jgi:hypothetical protein
MLAETSHTPFIDVDGVSRLDPAILAIPDIKVPMNRFRGERVEPFGFLTSTILVFRSARRLINLVTQWIMIYSLRTSCERIEWSGFRPWCTLTPFGHKTRQEVRFTLSTPPAYMFHS